MRRASPLRLISTACVLGGATLLASAGCADNDSSLFIKGAMAPTGECIFEAEGDAALALTGIMDVAYASTYTLPLLVGNQLIARGDADKLRTETARVVIRGAVVNVLSADGTSTLSSFSTNAGGFVDPSSGTDPGWGVSFVNAVSNELATQLQSELALFESRELNISVYVYGDTLGGDEVESSTLTFPLFVCNGCLVDCSTADSVGRCDVFPPEGLELSCFPGQDSALPCQLLTDPEAYCG